MFELNITEFKMNELHDLRDFSDALVANSSVKWGMGGGAVTSIFGSFSNNDLLVIIGCITTGLGFLVNLFYQYKRIKELKKLMSFKRRYLRNS